MKQFQQNAHKTLLPMAFILPIWLIFGRGMLGSTGWVTVILFFTLVPLLLALLLLTSFLTPASPELGGKKVLTQMESNFLLTGYIAIFLYGIFVMDGGDTQESVGSVFSHWFGSSLEPFSIFLSWVTFLIAAIALITFFVMIIVRRVRKPKVAAPLQQPMPVVPSSAPMSAQLQQMPMPQAPVPTPVPFQQVPAAPTPAATAVQPAQQQPEDAPAAPVNQNQ